MGLLKRVSVLVRTIKASLSVIAQQFGTIGFDGYPLARSSQKTLKRREPHRHEVTKFIPGLSEPQAKKVILCAFVVQGFLSFVATSLAKRESGT